MAYGALVVQLIQDYEDYAEVNKQLEKMYVSSRCTRPTLDTQYTTYLPIGAIILARD